MISGIKLKTTVKSGGVVEIYSDELPEGATVEVIVLVAPAEETAADARKLSSFIGAAKGNFSTVEEVDQFVRQEREAWDSRISFKVIG